MLPFPWYIRQPIRKGKKVKNCRPKTGKWMVILQLNITRLFIHASIKPAPEQLMVNNEQQIFFQD